MRLYLDVCSLNRPFDDLSIGRNLLEAEAVLEILRQVTAGVWQLVSSEAVDAELSLIPRPDTRGKLEAFTGLATDKVRVTDELLNRASALTALGIEPMDALHVTCAESAACDVFLTTDDQLLRRATAQRERIMVRVANPLVWVAEVSLS